MTWKDNLKTIIVVAVCLATLHHTFTELRPKSRTSSTIPWTPPTTNYEFEYQLSGRGGTGPWIPTDHNEMVDFGRVMRNAGLEQVTWGDLDLGYYFSVRTLPDVPPLNGPLISKQEAASQFHDLINKYKPEFEYIVRAYPTRDVNSSQPSIVITKLYTRVLP